MIPGIKAVHAIITDTCRENRGDEGAIDEALRRVKEEYMACAPVWPAGTVQFHVVLTVERKKEGK